MEMWEIFRQEAQRAGFSAFGVCPFAPFADRLLPCRAAARIPAGAKSVLSVLFPYRSAGMEEAGRNLSRYACVEDYHMAGGQGAAGAGGGYGAADSGKGPLCPFLTIPPSLKWRPPPGAALAWWGKTGCSFTRASDPGFLSGRSSPMPILWRRGRSRGAARLRRLRGRLSGEVPARRGSDWLPVGADPEKRGADRTGRGSGAPRRPYLGMRRLSGGLSSQPARCLRAPSLLFQPLHPPDGRGAGESARKSLWLEGSGGAPPQSANFFGKEGNGGIKRRKT